MLNWLHAIGVFLILMGITATVIGLARHFFPMLNQYLPETFKQPLSATYGSYYLLAGLLLLIL